MSGSTLLTGAPGVYSQEYDLSGSIVPGDSTIVAFAFPCKRGPIGPVTVTSPDQFIENYDISPDWGLGPQSILRILKKNSPVNMRLRRVVSADAQNSGVTITNDVAGSNAISSYALSNANGARYNTFSYAQQHVNLAYSAAFVASNSITVTISDGTTTATTTAVVFNTDSDNTLQLVCDKINSEIFGNTLNFSNLNQGWARVIKNNNSTSDDRIIAMVMPEGFVATTVSSAVTLGSSQATATASFGANLLNFYAENPGGWSKNYGIAFSDFNIGVNQRRKLTFSAALVTGNSVMLKFNVLNVGRVNVGPISFTTNSDATMAAIATAIKSALGGTSDAFVTQVSGTTTDDREITIVAPNDGPGVLTVVEAIVTGGASQATITNTEILAGISADDTFKVKVYSRANVNVPIETHLVSLKNQLDGFGKQQFIEDVINDSALKSKYIRVKFNTANASGTLLANLANNVIYWLDGGSDGSYPSNSAIVTAWDDFADPEEIRFQLAFSGGYNSLQVQQKIASLVTARKDGYACLDVPSEYQATGQNAADWRNTILNVDSRYVGAFLPDVKYIDPYTDRLVYIPPSAVAIQKLIWVDKNYTIYDAAAGLKRGLVDDIIGVRYKYKSGDLGIIENAGLNPIKQFNSGAGIALFGENTLQKLASLLSSQTVSRFMTFLQQAIIDTLQYDVFDNPTEQTYFLIRQRVEKFLKVYKDAGGLSNFKVIINAGNNTAPFRDAGQMNIDVYFWLVRPAKRILLRTYATPSSISFEEIVG